MKPLLFLEVAGVLSTRQSAYTERGLPVPQGFGFNLIPTLGTKEFGDFILQNCEVVWLSISHGSSDWDRLGHLARMLYRPVEDLRQTHIGASGLVRIGTVERFLADNPDRPFFWLDSYFTQNVKDWAVKRNCTHLLIECNGYASIQRLGEVQEELTERFSFL